MLIRSLRGMLRKYAWTYASLRNCSQKFVEMSSDLYMYREKRQMTNLDPYIDVDDYFNNITKLKLDLEKRNVSVNVDELYRHSVTYKSLLASIAMMQKNMKIMQKEEASVEEGKTEALKSRIAEAREKLVAVKEAFHRLEKSFIIPFLRIPNHLHKNTGKEDEVVFSLFPKPEFSFAAKSHIELGQLRQELCFLDVSPMSYFLKGRLAALEIALGDYFLSRLKVLGYRNYSFMNSVRAGVAEGCGLNTKDPRTLKLFDRDNPYSHLTQILVGSSSLPSYVVILCKSFLQMTVDTPIRFAAVGRKYQTPTRPHRDPDLTKNLFTAIQSTCVSGLVVYPVDMDEELVFNELAMMLAQMYTELGLHFTLVQYGAPNLRPYESLAIGVCMYSPYYKTYIEVGRISLCQDYISKRLQIFQFLDKSKGVFAEFVYLEMLDMKSWIGCMMENTQDAEGNFTIPKCLEPYMFTL